MSVTAEESRETSSWERAQQVFACEHSQQQLTFKDARNGARYFRMQCLRCGDTAQVVARSDLSPADIRSAVPFNDARKQQWIERRRAYWESLEDVRRQQEAEEQERESAEWRRRYNAHVNPSNPKWRALRELVMRRAGGTCEGCGVRPAVQVHHLTYDHLGDEFLWELRAVCVPCHERIHAE